MGHIKHSIIVPQAKVATRRRCSLDTSPSRDLGPAHDVASVACRPCAGTNPRRKEARSTLSRGSFTKHCAHGRRRFCRKRVLDRSHPGQQRSGSHENRADRGGGPSGLQHNGRLDFWPPTKRPRTLWLLGGANWSLRFHEGIRADLVWIAYLASTPGGCGNRSDLASTQFDCLRRATRLGRGASRCGGYRHPVQHGSI